MKTLKVAVIADIHGRDFWKKAKEKEYDKVIFLGDYLDSYTISPTKQKDNLFEIYEWWKNDKRVKCLIANHK